jgi:PAS domain S-box-containing protein
LKNLIEGTADAAFAVDGSGAIVAWNRAAESLFGLSTDDAIGRQCGEVIQGLDECGSFCSRDCTVQQSVRKRHPVGNFDLQVPTPGGPRWCNVSVMIAEVANSTLPYSLHIVRAIDTRKRLELVVRDFLVSQTDLTPDQAAAVISSTRAPAQSATLSERELEVLRLLARGTTTAAIAKQLHISRTTVNNHIQHILRKLDVHTRLEAIRRAELAGLI